MSSKQQPHSTPVPCRRCSIRVLDPQSHQRRHDSYDSGAEWSCHQCQLGFNGQQGFFNHDRKRHNKGPIYHGVDLSGLDPQGAYLKFVNQSGGVDIVGGSGQNRDGIVNSSDDRDTAIATTSVNNNIELDPSSHRGALGSSPLKADRPKSIAPTPQAPIRPPKTKPQAYSTQQLQLAAPNIPKPISKFDHLSDNSCGPRRISKYTDGADAGDNAQGKGSSNNSSLGKSSQTIATSSIHHTAALSQLSSPPNTTYSAVPPSSSSSSSPSVQNPQIQPTSESCQICPPNHYRANIKNHQILHDNFDEKDRTGGYKYQYRCTFCKVAYPDKQAIINHALLCDHARSDLPTDLLVDYKRHDKKRRRMNNSCVDIVSGNGRDGVVSCNQCGREMMPGNFQRHCEPHTLYKDNLDIDQELYSCDQCHCTFRAKGPYRKHLIQIHNLDTTTNQDDNHTRDKNQANNHTRDNKSGSQITTHHKINDKIITHPTRTNPHMKRNCELCPPGHYRAQVKNHQLLHDNYDNKDTNKYRYRCTYCHVAYSDERLIINHALSCHELQKELALISKSLFSKFQQHQQNRKIVKNNQMNEYSINLDINLDYLTTSPQFLWSCCLCGREMPSGNFPGHLEHHKRYYSGGHKDKHLSCEHCHITLHAAATHTGHMNLFHKDIGDGISNGDDDVKVGVGGKSNTNGDIGIGLINMMMEDNTSSDDDHDDHDDDDDDIMDNGGGDNIIDDNNDDNFIIIDGSSDGDGDSGDGDRYRQSNRGGDGDRYRQSHRGGDDDDNNHQRSNRRTLGNDDYQPNNRSFGHDDDYRQNNSTSHNLNSNHNQHGSPHHHNSNNQHNPQNRHSLSPRRDGDDDNSDDDDDDDDSNHQNNNNHRNDYYPHHQNKNNNDRNDYSHRNNYRNNYHLHSNPNPTTTPTSSHLANCQICPPNHYRGKIRDHQRLHDNFDKNNTEYQYRCTYCQVGYNQSQLIINHALSCRHARAELPPHLKAEYLQYQKDRYRMGGEQHAIKVFRNNDGTFLSCGRCGRECAEQFFYRHCRAHNLFDSPDTEAFPERTCVECQISHEGARACGMHLQEVHGVVMDNNDYNNNNNRHNQSNQSNQSNNHNNHIDTTNSNPFHTPNNQTKNNTSRGRFNTNDRPNNNDSGASSSSSLDNNNNNNNNNNYHINDTSNYNNICGRLNNDTNGNNYHTNNGIDNTVNNHHSLHRNDNTATANTHHHHRSSNTGRNNNPHSRHSNNIVNSTPSNQPTHRPDRYYTPGEFTDSDDGI